MAKICSLLCEAYCFSVSQDIGAGKGKYYAVNFPLRDGIDDDCYEQVFQPVRIILKKVSSCYALFDVLSVFSILVLHDQC